MLTARSDLVFGGSRVGTWLCLARRFRAVLIHRRGLVYDSRFSSAAEPRPGALNVYIVHAGVLTSDEGGKSRGPAVWTFTDSEFESADRAGPTFRSWGTPFVALDLRLREGDVIGPVGVRAGPRALSAASTARVATMVDAFERGGEAEAPLRAIVSSLVADGILAAAFEAEMHVPDVESEGFRRLWMVASQLYARSEVLPHLTQMADTAGVSYRQLDRDIADFCRTYQLQGDSLRSLTRTIRVREALLLLSAPGTTVTEVAKQAGYGSPAAMARAFRDAGLPAPSRVRAAVAYPVA